MSEERLATPAFHAYIGTHADMLKAQVRSNTEQDAVSKVT
jgi:hypothetical protein